MVSATECNLGAVVSGQVRCRMRRPVPPRTPVAVLGAVSVDSRLAPGTVAWLVCVGAGLSALPFGLAPMGHTPRLILQLGTSGLSTRLEPGLGHVLLAPCRACARFCGCLVAGVALLLLRQVERELIVEQPLRVGCGIACGVRVNRLGVEIPKFRGHD